MVEIEEEVDNSEKHERVAKALEQINGLRYRYKGTGAKPEKKDINVDSDGDGSEDDASDDRADAKSSAQRRSSAQQQQQRADRLLTLDEHIERMLLRTRTVALLKIATNTAEVLPDEDEDDEDDDEFIDEADEYENDDEDRYDDRRRGRSKSGQGGDDLDGDESVDRFDSLGATGGTLSHVGSSHSSSMQRMGSMRRPPSFRTASFRSSNGAPADPEAAAALRLVRKLSTFLNLPKVISYRDLEEITESLLDEPHDESDEYAHLIDEHVDSARDSTGGDSSAATSDLRNASTRSLGARHLATQKSLRELNISDDPEDLELQQRRLFVENAGLRRYSSRKLIGASSHNLLRGASKQSLHGSPGASTRDMLAHKESKRSLTPGESWRSGGGPGSITSLMEESDEKDDDDGGDACGNASSGGGGGGSGELGDGVFGTTFDEHGYKQWRTEVKDDYLAWIRAKLEAKKQRRLQKQKDADKKPRWQLLYEAASKGRPSSAAEDEAKAEPRKGSVTKRPARQSIA